MNGEVELYSHNTHKIEACLPENEINPIAIQGLRQFCKACKLYYKNQTNLNHSNKKPFKCDLHIICLTFRMKIA